MPSLALSTLRTRLCDQGSQLLDGSSLSGCIAADPLATDQPTSGHTFLLGALARSLGEVRWGARGATGMKSGHKWIKLQECWSRSSVYVCRIGVAAKSAFFKAAAAGG